MPVRSNNFSVFLFFVKRSEAFEQYFYSKPRNTPWTIGGTYEKKPDYRNVYSGFSYTYIHTHTHTHTHT